MAIESLYRCTLRCMRSSVSRACHRLSGSRFKGPSGAFHNGHLHNHVGHEHQQKSEEKEKNSRRSQKGLPPLKVAFQGPTASKRTRNVKSGKKYQKRMTRSSSPNGHDRGRSTKQSSPPMSDSSADASCSEDGKTSPGSLPSPEGLVPLDSGFKASRWDARRRDPRMNGADLYVARITKNGCGNARPCWRCLEWCRWAGIKRIFHWNEVSNQFDVVKVNNHSADKYETHADIRLFAGLGW